MTKTTRKENANEKNHPINPSVVPEPSAPSPYHEQDRHLYRAGRVNGTWERFWRRQYITTILERAVGPKV
jgi:hypothetical protein